MTRHKSAGKHAGDPRRKRASDPYDKFLAWCVGVGGAAGLVLFWIFGEPTSIAVDGEGSALSGPVVFSALSFLGGLFVGAVIGGVLGVWIFSDE